MVKKIRSKIYTLLRWSEKYTKTDMLYLTKGGGWLVLGNSIAIISGLALSVAFANLVPKEVFGNYKFILSLAGIIGAFTLTGMGTVVTQAVARGFEGALERGFYVQLKWSILIVLISLSGAFYYFINDDNVLAVSLLIVGLFLPLLTSASLYGSYLTGKKDFKTNTIYGVSRNIFSVVSILSVLYFTQNPILVIFAYFLSNTIISGILYLKTINKCKPRQETDPSSINYSKHLSAMNVLSITVYHLDKILIFHFLGAAQLAIYVFAVALPLQLKGLSKIISALLLPKMSNRSIKNLKESVPQKMLQLLLVSVLLITIYIVTAPYIYKYLFPQYLESILFSQVVALVLLFTPSIFLTQTLVAHSKKKQLYIIQIVSAIIKFVLLFTLLPFFGIWGAIATLLASRAISTFVSLYMFKKL